jgi:hypothetical protein
MEHFERREIHTERLVGKLKESDGFEGIGIEWRMVLYFLHIVVCHHIF